MKIAVFGTRTYDREYLSAANAAYKHELVFFEPRLLQQTAKLAAGFPCVCSFVNDQLDRGTLNELAKLGTKLIALRCAGFNQVDLEAAKDAGIRVVRVPAYSPYAVAEHTVGLMLALNRKIHRAYNRVREGNFALDGLLGFDLHGRTVGVIGTGKIGAIVAEIMAGFGSRRIAYDKFVNAECVAAGVEYVSLDQLFAQANIVTLHCPLMPETHHLINEKSLRQMKRGVMLINTSRGGLVDTSAVIAALKSGKIGYLGLDVYEEEAELFFEDQSQRVLQDDVFARLLTFPNVIITGHQAFFTSNALEKIAETTLASATAFENGEPLDNEISIEMVKKS